MRCKRKIDNYARVVSIIMSIIVMMPILPTYGVHADTTTTGGKNQKHIMVSMGDSYSAGEGIEPFYSQDLPVSEKVKSDGWLAHRSESSWPGMLTIKGVDGKMSKNVALVNTKSKQVLAGNWFFVAASGATTENIEGEFPKDYRKEKRGYSKNKPYLYSGVKNLPPQIDVFNDIEFGEVDYVTLTLGGNDAGFTDIITTCVVQKLSYLEPNNLNEKLKDTWKRFNMKGGIADNLIDSYKKIEEKAGPQACIIVAGYPKLLNPDGYKYISGEEARLVNKNVSRFNNAIESIIYYLRAEGMNIEFVSVEKAFEGHGAYSGEDNAYINPIIYFANEQDRCDDDIVSSYSMHPTYEGARAYAQCVQERIDNIEEAESSIECSSDLVLEVKDKHANAMESYSVDISGVQYLGTNLDGRGFKVKDYQEAFDVSSDEPVKLSLSSGRYFIRVSVKNGTSDYYVKEVYVTSNKGESQIVFNTNYESYFNSMEYSVFNAQARINGIDGNGDGFYDILVNPNSELVYQQLAELAMEETGLYYTSGLWTTYFDDIIKNNPQYAYEAILMSYLSYDADSSEIDNTMKENIKSFGINFIAELLGNVIDSKITEHENALAIRNQILALPKDEAEKIFREKILLEVDSGLLSGCMNGWENTTELVKNLSTLSAADEKRDGQIAFLETVGSGIKDNDPLKKAIDDIVISYQDKNAFSIYSQSGKQNAYTVGKLLVSSGWDMLLDALDEGSELALYLKSLRLGGIGLNALFGTTTLSQDLMSILTLYIIDSEFKTSLCEMKDEFVGNPSAKNAEEFNTAFDSYLEFQNYANSVAKQYIYDIINSGVLTKSFTTLFHNENLETADELISLCDIQIENRRKILEINEKYFSIYCEKYNLTAYLDALSEIFSGDSMENPFGNSMGNDSKESNVNDRDYENDTTKIETKYLDNCTILESDEYQGNEGDSFVYPIGQHQHTRGQSDISGKTYYHGIEAWIARWNYKDEVSWAYSIFELPENMNSLSGEVVLIDSYNTVDFDSTLYFINADTDAEIESYHLTPDSIPFVFSVTVSGVQKLKIFVKDNRAVSGGTSFGLVNAILDMNEIDVPDIDDRILNLNIIDAANYLSLNNITEIGTNRDDRVTFVYYTRSGYNADDEQTRIEGYKEDEHRGGLWNIIITDQTASFYGVKIGMSIEDAHDALYRHNWITEDDVYSNDDEMELWYERYADDNDEYYGLYILVKKGTVSEIAYTPIDD